MRISTVVEPIPGRGYRASCGQPFDLSAEGTTIEEAVGVLKAQVQGRIDSGARIVDFDVQEDDHGIAASAGMFRDNRLFAQWQEAIADYRRRVDEDPNIL